MMGQSQEPIFLMTSVLRLVLPLQHLPNLPQGSHFPKLMATATFSAIPGCFSRHAPGHQPGR